MDLRLTFDEAVNDDRLMGEWFLGKNDNGRRIGGLSFAQQACLLAAYGCHLDHHERDAFGWTRLDYFWASQGYAHYDDEGYITRVEHPGPYLPRIYPEVWVIAGVRGGKSDRIAATAVVYEALFGGHEQWVRPGKLAYCLQICQDLRLARESLHGIEATLQSIPFIHTPAKTQWSGKGGERIGRRTADFIRLWNGIAIMTMPPTVKAVRGYDSPISVLDEVGIWPTGEDAANVDSEVFQQAKSRQAQFEHPKIFGISSPWINSGLLFDRYKVGTQGKNVLCASCLTRGPIANCPTCKVAREGYQNLLVCHFTTASMGNPLITREWLRDTRLADPAKFRRENLALFDSPAGAFLSASLLDAAIDKGIVERPSAYVHEPGKPPAYYPVYVAALDAGFRRDRFTFGISHVDEHGKIQLDLLRMWKPAGGENLEPVEILNEITPLIREYRVVSVHSDSYSFEALNALCLQHGWSIERTSEFGGQNKNNIMGNLKQTLEQHTLRLLDHPEAVAELKNLQRKVLPTGYVRIAAPGAQHDDLAMCIALLAFHCIWFLPSHNEEARKPTIEELCQKQADRKKTSVVDDIFADL